MIATPDPYETPEYLLDVEPMPPESLALVEEGEVRELTAREQWQVELEIHAACRRVRSARRDRDGKD